MRVLVARHDDDDPLLFDLPEGRPAFQWHSHGPEPPAGPYAAGPSSSHSGCHSRRWSRCRGV